MNIWKEFVCKAKISRRPPTKSFFCEQSPPRAGAGFVKTKDRKAARSAKKIFSSRNKKETKKRTRKQLDMSSAENQATPSPPPQHPIHIWLLRDPVPTEIISK